MRYNSPKILNVNKDTAWRMQMKIWEAMVDQGELLMGIVEMDETYIGGKPRKGDKSKDNKPGRGTKRRQSLAWSSAMAA